MKLISRYLISQLATTTIFALICLLGLYGFFDIVGELPKVGTNNYSATTMLLYVLMQAPSHAYELMPLAVLIGCMAAMTQLASHSEYTIIRTSGISLVQIAGMLLGFGLIFAVMTMLLGEFVSPYLETKAQRMRLEATRSVVAHDFRSGIWLKDNNHLINVREMLPDNTLQDVRVYTYDNDYRLTQSRYAESGTYQGQGEWLLRNVRDTDLTADRTFARHYDQTQWKSIIEPNILRVLLVEPEQMSAQSLVTYIHHLSSNQQKTQRYEIALWGKLFYPLACVSMSLIAMAFIPRQRRHGQLGRNLFFGICLGIGFHFVNRLFGFLSLRYDWNPPLSAMLPTTLLFIIGVLIIMRQEKR